jgi:hypothetical protein
VFCTRRPAKVYAGGYFECDGQTWRHDDLMELAQTWVTLHKPLFGDRGRIFVFDEQDRDLICEATPEQPIAFGDRAGAGEQARRKKKLTSKIRKLAAQIDRVDPVQAVADARRLRGKAGSAGALVRDAFTRAQHHHGLLPVHSTANPGPFADALFNRVQPRVPTALRVQPAADAPADAVASEPVAA